jgi:hypothetical protein
MSARKTLARRLLPRDVEGGWICQAWRILYQDGSYTEPFGSGLSGLLIYSADGYMSACIMAAGRAPFRSSNPREATRAERAAAFDGYFSYAGRWRIVGETIEHRVTVALNPAFVGTRQWRKASLSGRRLVLSAEEKTSRGIRRHEIEWRRGRVG